MAFNILVWVIQVVLALLFLFAGGMKLIVPIEALAGPVALPGLFMRFIGVCEVLGAFGLILPSALRIRPRLTPLAAALLIIIMIGASSIMAFGVNIGAAAMPFTVGLLLAFVCYSRVRVAPISKAQGARQSALASN